MSMRSKDTLRRILSLYINDRYDEAIESEVQRWLASEIDDERKDEALAQVWEDAVKEDMKPGRETYQALERVRERLGMPLAQAGRGRRMRLFNKQIYRIAAVLIPIIIIITGTLYMSYEQGQNDKQIVERSVSVPGGSYKRIMLPDGSRVMLNGNSELRYDEERFAQNRQVTLEGEAFFSVARDEDAPFVVKANAMEVEVLGTEFNVATKAGGNGEVVVKGGRVRVSVDRKAVVMEARDKLSYDHATGEILLGVADEGDGWWDEPIAFEMMPLRSIFDSLATYYGTPFMLVGDVDASSYSFEFDRTDDIEEILQVMKNFSGTFDYSVGPDRITITTK